MSEQLSETTIQNLRSIIASKLQLQGSFPRYASRLSQLTQHFHQDLQKRVIEPLLNSSEGEKNGLSDQEAQLKLALQQSGVLNTLSDEIYSQINPNQLNAIHDFPTQNTGELLKKLNNDIPHPIQEDLTNANESDGDAFLKLKRGHKYLRVKLKSGRAFVGNEDINGVN